MSKPRVRRVGFAGLAAWMCVVNCVYPYGVLELWARLPAIVIELVSLLLAAIALRFSAVPATCGKNVRAGTGRDGPQGLRLG